MSFPFHFLAIGGLFLGLVIRYKYNHWRAKTHTHKSKGMSPPEPSGAWPVIGHLHLLQGKVPFFRTLAAMADKLGPVFVVRLGMVPTLVVSNHEVVKECFTTNDKAFASRPNSAAAKILGYDYAVFPFSPYGPLWREMRKLSVLELLSTIRSSGSTHLLVSELDAGIKDLYMLGKDNSWVNPQKVVMSEWFEHLTFNVILRMIAGKRYFNNLVHGVTKEARSAIAAINKLIHYLLGATVASDVIPFLEWVDLKGHFGEKMLHKYCLNSK